MVDLSYYLDVSRWSILVEVLISCDVHSSCYSHFGFCQPDKKSKKGFMDTCHYVSELVDILLFAHDDRARSLWYNFLRIVILIFDKICILSQIS